MTAVDQKDSAPVPAATPPAAGRVRDVRRRRGENGWALVFLAPQLVGLLVFVLGPLLFAMGLSLVSWDGLSTPEFVGLDNFTRQFGDGTFHVSLRNTIYFTVLLVPGELACALLVALALHTVRGRVIYRLFYFAPVVTSSVAVSVVWLWLLNGEFGPINGYLRDLGLDPPNWLVDSSTVIPAIAMVSIWRGIGFSMVIFLAGLQAVPKEYLEAATVDGAGSVRRFWHITLPMLSPTILFLAVMSFIGSFQVFDLSYTMTRGGPGTASYTLVYDIYDLAFTQFRFGDSAAVAVVLFAILLVVTLVQLRLQRRFVHYEE
jgi:multiple sugar transport system permease protein